MDTSWRAFLRAQAKGCWPATRVTARALDFALAASRHACPDGQADRLVELYDHLRPFPDAIASPFRR